MNATKRLDILISNLVHHDERSMSVNGASQEASIQPLSPLTFTGPDCSSTSVLPPTISPAAVPLPPRRDASSLKHHRRRHPIDSTDKNKQPLLNSSTLDDLFQALTLECEQYLAATIANKAKEQLVPSVKKQAMGVESNDEDYENLQASKSAPSTSTTTPSSSSLKTSIEVISPIKRHVVSITVSSRVAAAKIVPLNPTSLLPPPLPLAPLPAQPEETPVPNIVEPPVCRSSEEDPADAASSNTGRRRRRRTRKRMVSSTTTRSSSSSSERNEPVLEKKPTISKRSCSTDHRHHRSRDVHESTAQFSSHRGTARRKQRRDVSLQHSFTNSSSYRQEPSTPLSMLLTSGSKSTSDFLDQSHTRSQQRRSRLETLPHKPLTLLDRMHQQFYRLPPRTNQKTNIPTVNRIPSYRVY